MGNKTSSSTSGNQPDISPDNRLILPPHNFKPQSQLTSIQTHTIQFSRQYPDLKACSKDQPIHVAFIGTSDCGKTTIFKQFRQLSEQPELSYMELQSFANIIRQNVIFGLIQLVQHVSNFNDITPSNQKAFKIIEELSTKYPFNVYPSLQGPYEVLDDLITNVDILHSEHDLKKYFVDLTIFVPLWLDPIIQDIWLHRSNDYRGFYQMNYWMKQFSTIMSPSFSPTHNDIIHAKCLTTRVHIDYSLNTPIGTQFYASDNAGTSTRSWSTDDNVDICIFVASLSEFNQILPEVQELTRFEATLLLFNELLRTTIFQNARFIILLTKYDTFLEELPLGQYRHNQDSWNGDSCNEDSVITDILERFSHVYNTTTNPIDRQFEFMIINTFDMDHIQHILYKIGEYIDPS